MGIKLYNNGKRRSSNSKSSRKNRSLRKTRRNSIKKNNSLRKTRRNSIKKNKSLRRMRQSTQFKKMVRSVGGSTHVLAPADLPAILYDASGRLIHPNAMTKEERAVLTGATKTTFLEGLFQQEKEDKVKRRQEKMAENEKYAEARRWVAEREAEEDRLRQEQANATAQAESDKMYFEGEATYY